MVRPLTVLAALPHLLPGLLIALLLATPLTAQDPTAASKGEAELNAESIAKLHELADAYAKDKQHATALAMRREILLHYDEEDEKARQKCGFSRVGNRWQPDPNRLVIDKDLTGTKKIQRKLNKERDRFRKTQLRGHRNVAKLWTKAGDNEKAAAHWRRVLALSPGDKTAAKALALAQFQGFRGSAVELARLRRAWAIRGAVEWMHRHEFPVEKIEGRKQPLLEKAEIEHEGFRSENFEIWGTLGDQLPQIAAHCERALFLCRTVFGVSQGQPFEPRGYRSMVLVRSDKDYAKVLDQCADQFDPGRLHFLKTQVDLSFLNSDGEPIRFIKTNGTTAEAFDQSVRGAVQDAVGIKTDGLWEGVGHAGCGMLFGRTITFLLEQQDARTVASWARQLLVPEMEAWMKIAEQSAWAKSDTRTSELVLISAARFSTEQRVKAWAICDYFFHWRPELIWELDQSQSDVAKTPPEVELQFQRRTQIPLPKIDFEWREYWARGAELRKAMQADPLGEPKGRDRKLRTAARELVDAVNVQRVAANRGPVGFYFAEDSDIAATLQYADKLVKAERDQKKKPKEKIPLPTPPAAIGKHVLFSRQGTAVAAVAEWWQNPVARDAMLHAGRGLLGANKNRNALVLDLSETIQATTRGKPWTWPRFGQPTATGKARVGDLGPEVIAALAAKGKGVDDFVAMPWSLHFGRRVEPADLDAITATVYVRGQKQRGVFVVLQGPEDSAANGAHADGCVTFVGLEPAPEGADVEVTWRLPEKFLAGDEVFRPIEFTAK
ncbi:MAG: hypothetical protein NXI31_20120 [bacterium]|nr:hypothetical protein [bacterium]